MGSLLFVIKCFQMVKRRAEILENQMEIVVGFFRKFLKMILEAGGANEPEILIFVCIAWCQVILGVQCH